MLTYMYPNLTCYIINWSFNYKKGPEMIRIVFDPNSVYVEIARFLLLIIRAYG